MRERKREHDLRCKYLLQQVTNSRTADELIDAARGFWTMTRVRPETRAAALDAMKTHSDALMRALPLLVDDHALLRWILGEVLVPEQLETLAQEHFRGVRPLAPPLRLSLSEAWAAACGSHAPGTARLAADRLALLNHETAALARDAAPPAPFSVDNSTRVHDLRGRTGDRARASAGQTREATMMQIDGAQWRVKQIKYGPRSAANEVLNSRVMALTGIAAPETRLARKGAQPDCVASRMMPGFMDLGAFLLAADTVRPLIRAEHGAEGETKFDNLHAAFTQASNEAERLRLQLPPEPVGHHHPLMRKIREQNATRLQARKKIFALLPPQLRREIEKAQFLSQLIGDFDFLNFEGFNAGFILPGFKVAVLDQGNAGISGFKGGQKHPMQANLADQPAKDTDPFVPNTLARREYQFRPDLGPSRAGIGAIARAIPVAAFLRDAIAADTETAERDPVGPASSRPGRIAAPELDLFTGQMEAAYRLSLIPDEALRRICMMYWPEPDDPGVPYPETHTLRPTAAEYAEIYIARRAALVNKFRPEDMRKWEDRNAARAQAAYAEVAAAVARETGIHVPPRVPADGRLREAPL